MFKINHKKRIIIIYTLYLQNILQILENMNNIYIIIICYLKQNILIPELYKNAKAPI